jgi:streptogramin lyase
MTGKGLKVAIASALAAVVALAMPGLARATSITEFTSGITTPGDVLIGADGNGWFINGAGIAKIDSSGHVTTYTMGLNSGATPFDLTNGPNNDLWFTDNGTTKAVGYITTSGTIHEFSAPAGQTPLQIVAGSDGNLWFALPGLTFAVGKMTPGGTFTASPYSLPMNGVIDDNMVLGPDKDIWFSDKESNSIGKISPSGTVTEYFVAANAMPTDITVGPDGNLWFSDDGGTGAAIGRITTGGSVQEFKNGLQTNADPDAITAGPDGNVWFTDQYANQRAIGRVTPSGGITEFKNGLSPDLPLDITTGADGNLWVPQAASMFPTSPAAIAEITPSGQITEITKGVNPTGLQDGDSITPGADGSLWFTDNVTKAVGRITLAPLVSTGAATAITTTSATISGSVTPLANATAVSIEYGTTPTLGASTVIASLPAGTTKVSVTGALTGLPVGTTIYYRIAATNSAGETDGLVASFATSNLPPPPPPPPPPPSIQRTAAKFGNQQITLTTPPSSICTARTGKLSLTLSSTTIKKSNKAKLKFASAALYIDKGVRHTTIKTVRKHGRKVKVTIVTYRANALLNRLPASPKLKLQGLKSGRHTLKVTLSYTEPIRKHGRKSHKTVAKTLTAKFAVC